jgi:hypothetical protein
MEQNQKLIQLFFGEILQRLSEEDAARLVAAYRQNRVLKVEFTESPRGATVAVAFHWSIGDRNKFEIEALEDSTGDQQ